MSARRTKRTLPNAIRKRTLWLERLESRHLLASDWQNSFNPFDVDDNGEVTPFDALLVINDLLRNGGRSLGPVAPGNRPPAYVDVNGSGSVEPLDALQVFNALNSAGVPESSAVTVQRFRVDAASGNVSVSPVLLNPSSGEGETLFAGNTIAFNANVVLDQRGNAGRRVLNVSLTNNSGETIGQLPDGTETGLRVLFSPFTQLKPSADLRTKSVVNPFAGTGAAGSADGLLGSATFRNPRGITLDSEGRFYVTDYFGHTIRKIEGNFVSTLAGNGAAGSADGIGAAASFNNPWGIAVNPVDEALIVTDFTGNLVRRVTANGEVTTIAGTGAAGDANGTGNVSTFRNPAGVTIASDGTIYVVEVGGHRVRKIVKTGSDPKLASSYAVSVFAGTTASPPATGAANGTGTAARFNGPRDLTIDDLGTLYVTDTNNDRIRRITALGAVTTIAGTGTPGTTDGAGNLATFFSPQGIAAIGHTTLLVSDTTGQKVRQVRLAVEVSPDLATSWQVQTIAGPDPGVQTPGNADGDGSIARFNSPRGIVVDGRDAYIADSLNNQIRRLNSVNGFPVTLDPVQLANADGFIPVPNPLAIASGSQPVRDGIRPFVTYTGSLANGATSATEPWVFIVPNDVRIFEFTVTVEANTRFFAPPVAVSNSGSTGVGSRHNMVRTVAGSNVSGFVDGLATEARFGSVGDIAVDGVGNRYVVDYKNHAIRRISVDGIVSTVAGVAGMGSGRVDGDGTVAKFNEPIGIAIAPDNRTLYVAEYSNHTIRRISFKSGDPTLPANWSVSTIAGSGWGYVDNTTGDLARFNTPYGVAISEGGVIYVTEYDGHRVRRLQQVGTNPDLATSWRVTHVAGDTRAVIGEFGNADGMGSEARFSNLGHIAVDRAGIIYVVDTFNSRIRRITPFGEVSTFAGSIRGYADGIGANARFQNPISIAVDDAGYVYVGELNRVRRISPSGVVTTVAGGLVESIGTTDRDGTGDVAQFHVVTGIDVDAAGSLHLTSGAYFVSSTGSNSATDSLRVRMIERIISVA